MRIDININQNLTSDEQEIFAIIKNVIAKYTPSTNAYVAGGWVRDKLLGIDSNDIDIMLSNISGENFAKLLTNHLNLKDPHVIKSNPEKSKNITTSKAYIPLSSGKTQEIDFAQARSETYNHDSRIPNIQPSTPQEDAQRRDLTINAIFYDIKNNTIRDFTGMGIKDLSTNTIRTPMDPYKTFSDDPLRIFRTIRFAAKYNSKIDDKTYNAMSDPNLRNIIKQKISKERIGQEFLKMLKNPNPDKALQLLKDTGLLEDIISEAVKGTEYENKIEKLEMDQSNPHHKLNLWGHTMQVIKNTLDQYKESEPEKKVIMILASLMHDIGKTYNKIWGTNKDDPSHKTYYGHEDESSKLVPLIFRYLKIEPYIQEISSLVKEHMHPHQLLDASSPRILRRFIRQMGEKSLNWLDVFNLAVSDAYAKDTTIDSETVQKYQDLQNKLQEALVSLSASPDTTEIKSILDGNEIMQALNIKSGPQIKTLLEFVKELKDENPNITKEEAIAKLKEYYNNIKTASNGGIQKKSICPKHLLKKEIDDINDLFKEKKYYQIITILNNLKNNYRDESIDRLLAISIFRILIKDKKYKDNDLIRYIFSKAELNFFDCTLCAYCVGILLLLDAQTKDSTIKEIAQRIANMYPGILKNVLDLLPKEIYRSNLKKEIEKFLK